jgi:hypothetical protein
MAEWADLSTPLAAAEGRADQRGASGWNGLVSDRE